MPRNNRATHKASRREQRSKRVRQILVSEQVYRHVMDRPVTW